MTLFGVKFRYNKKVHHEIVLIGFAVAALAAIFEWSPYQQAAVNAAVNVIWLWEPEA